MSAREPAANWAGNVVYARKRLHRPGSVEELRRLVARAARIRALGSGHSFSLVADTVDDQVVLDGLPPEVVVAPDRSTATVAAGLRYGDVAAALHRSGLALANLASLPHISVAGSVATGTHGSGDGQQCLSGAVTALELVGPDGGTVRLSRADDPEVFPGAVVALGALGVVTRLTLAVEPAYRVAQRVRVDVPLEEVADRYDEVFGAAYSVSAFTDWRSGRADVWLKHRVDRPAGTWSGGRPADRPMHPVPGMPAGSSTPQLGVAGPWHERLPHFRPDLTPGAGAELQSEYYLPREAAPAAIAAVRELGELVAPVLHVAELRTVRADDLWLSPAYRRDSATFHFTWVRDLPAVRPVLEAVERRLMPLGARPHWGKLTAAAPAATAAGYRRAADFAALAHRLDPDGKFRNGFVDALFPRGPHPAPHPTDTHRPVSVRENP
ncbi:D-arabinono-1,4-lactone oxidase [Kitasatospora sp. NPDC101176]|uniref:D-arabinono-1,4-lactone oxidase n=1 Tax=Kitasatospora sp. NPDC101176 TaxID=3364099 RepID=UPI003815B680